MSTMSTMTGFARMNRVHFEQVIGHVVDCDSALLGNNNRYLYSAKTSECDNIVSHLLLYHSSLSCYIK